MCPPLIARPPLDPFHENPLFNENHPDIAHSPFLSVAEGETLGLTFMYRF